MKTIRYKMPVKVINPPNRKDGRLLMSPITVREIQDALAWHGNMFIRDNNVSLQPIFIDYVNL